MSEKKLTTRIQQKTDTKANWDKATNFVPLKGEYIYYSDINRVKVGDGVKKLSELPFVTSINDIANGFSLNSQSDIVWNSSGHIDNWNNVYFPWNYGGLHWGDQRRNAAGHRIDLFPSEIDRESLDLIVKFSGDYSGDAIKITQDISGMQEEGETNLTLSADGRITCKGITVKNNYGNSSITVGNKNVLTDHQPIKTLKTDNAAAQTPSANESIAGSDTINLHKVAKTGSYNDLNDRPTTLSGYGITDAYTKTESDGKYVTIDTEQTVSAKKNFTDTIEVKGAEINAEARIGTYPSSIEATGILNEDAVDNWVAEKRVDFENHKISSGAYFSFEYPDLLEHYGLHGQGGAGSVPFSVYDLNKDVSIPETITTEEQLKAYVKSSDFASAADSAGYTVIAFILNDVATYHSDIQSISFDGTNIVGDASLDCQRGEGEQIVDASDPITEPMLKTKNLKVENLEVENSLIKNMNVGGSLSVGGKNVLTSVTAGSGISIETSDDGTVKISCSYSDGDMEAY